MWCQLGSIETTTGLRSPKAPAAQAAQLDIAGFVKLGFVKTDQCFEIAGGELFQNATVPAKLGIGVAVRARKM